MILIMSKPFPRKEIYVYTIESPLGSEELTAVYDKGKLKFSNYFEGYAQGRWDAENKGWTSSVIPSVVEIDITSRSMTLHFATTQYHKLLGMVKLAAQRGITDDKNIVHGLSIETVPFFADGIVIFERRKSGATQHAVGVYDFPTASQNAQMYLGKAEGKFLGLVKDMFDMTGFPKFHIARAFDLNPNDVAYTDYVGFSRGFEVSLDTQINGFVGLAIESKEVINGEKAESRLVYKKDRLLDVLDSIGTPSLPLDEYGHAPQPASQTERFAIVDDCLGTILSTLYHTQGKRSYYDALEILKKKGYTINEVIPINNKVILNELI